MTKLKQQILSILYEHLKPKTDQEVVIHEAANELEDMVFMALERIDYIEEEDEGFFGEEVNDYD